MSSISLESCYKCATDHNPIFKMEPLWRITGKVYEQTYEVARTSRDTAVPPR